MKAQNLFLDTSKELLIHRYGHGIKLVRPELHSRRKTIASVGDILELPLNVYFLNTESAIQNINETTINSCGFTSIRSTLGKTVHIAFKKETAEASIAHDRQVMQTNSMKIREFMYERLDGLSVPFISIRFPWYAAESNKIVGIFGFSILLNNTYSLSEALTTIAHTGLLALSTEKSDSISPIPHPVIAWSPRETECLQLLMRGKTAKQIGRILNLSYRTVEDYFINIKRKANVATKAELIEKFIDHFIR